MAFTKQEFEDALKEALITITHGDRSRAKLKYLGVLTSGYYTYAIWVASSINKRIVARFMFADCVLWLEYFHARANSWFTLDGTPIIHLTFEQHWQQHMADGLQRLWDIALEDTHEGPQYQPTAAEQAESETYLDHGISRYPTPHLQPVERLDRQQKV